MRTRRIQYLRPEEILAEIQRRPLIYWPIGPIEWHGPHLPVGTDAINAENAAERAAELTGGLVLPTFYWGTERERSPQVLQDLGLEKDAYIVGMDFPANSLVSGYAGEEFFALLVREQLRILVHMGFRQIVLVTGHGATNQIEVLNRLALEFSSCREVKVLVELPFVRDADGVLRVGHASRIETSLMQDQQPDAVKIENLPPRSAALRNIDWAIVDYATFLGQPMPDRTVRPDDDPRDASSAEGRRILQQVVEQIVRDVNQIFK